MKDKEYIKSINSEENLLLAEFDGWELRHNSATSSNCWFNSKKKLGYHMKKGYVFQYNKYEELMPIVECIVEMRYYITIGPRSVKIFDAGLESKILIFVDIEGYPLAEQEGRTTIVKWADKPVDRLKIALVEFVKWYKTQE